MKILVVRYRFIGDTVLSLPFLKNLRTAYPNAQIDMLVAPKSGEIIENCPYVNNFIYFDTTRKHKYENVNERKKSFFSYVKLLKKEKYDKAYVLKRSFSSAALVFLAGIKERIGFDTEGRGFLLTKKVKYDENKHESLCFCDLLKADGIPADDFDFENNVTPEEENKVTELFKEYGITNDKKAVVHACATNPGKLWSEENFAQIIEYLSNEKGVRVLFTGTDFDTEKYERILRLIKVPLNVSPANFCGKLSLRESLALIKAAEFLIGNDSGNLHMASSVKIPVIGLYGPMSFEKWHALGDNNIFLKADLPCVPCGLRGKCKIGYSCMKQITVESVKNAVDEICSRKKIS